MIAFNRIVIAISILSLAWAFQAAAEEKSPCDNIVEHIIGQCFRAHGRLSVYNGNPTYRIWVIGTRHLLGVSSWWVQPNQNELPKNVQELLPSDFPPETAIYGDYEVCPLTEEHIGWMQSVCIKRASHLVSIPRSKMR
jgi:hypothetical protein